jgi:hypothetical protein
MSKTHGLVVARSVHLRYPSSRLALLLANDISISFIRNDRRTKLPEHTVIAAGHGNAVTRTQEAYGIPMPPDVNVIAIAGKGQSLIAARNDDRLGA